MDVWSVLEGPGGLAASSFRWVGLWHRGGAWASLGAWRETEAGVLWKVKAAVPAGSGLGVGGALLEGWGYWRREGLY